jgi:hypothetical protein
MKALATTPVAARATPPSHESRPREPLRTLFLRFPGVGAVAFGVGMLQKLKTVMWTCD